MAEAPVAQALQADAKDLGFKTFVGNLAFSTTNEDLKQTFGKAGEVTDAQVITRGTRSLGYGFVTFATEEAATTAISTLDKSTLNDRQINVELAKPGAGVRQPAARVAKDAAAAAVKSQATSATQVDGENAGAEGASKKPRKKKNNKKKGPRQPKEGEEGAPAPAEGASSEKPTTAGTRKPRPPRKPRGAPEDGAPSPTLVFVANLPFSLDEAGLTALFTDMAGVKVTKTTIVTKKYGMGAGRNKGFAFVDLADQEAQKKAIEVLHESEVEGRNITVKVALERGKEESGDRAREDSGDKKEDNETGLASGEVIAS